MGNLFSLSELSLFPVSLLLSKVLIPWASLIAPLVKNLPAVQKTFVRSRKKIYQWSGRSPEEGIGYSLQYSWASLVAQLVENPPAMQET